MAPPAGGAKRKRGDRSYSGDSFDGQRPSPHRPGNLNLAHQGQGSPYHGYRDNQEYRGRGRGRGGRGGAGRGAPRSPHQSPNNSFSQQRSAGLTTQSNPDSSSQSQQQSDVSKSFENKTETTVAVASTQTPPPDDPPAYYLYDFLDEESLNTWSESGRANLTSRGVQARKEQDILNLSLIFQELVRSALDARVRTEEAGAAVKDILEKDRDGDDDASSFNASSIFLDTLTMFAPNTGTKDNQLSKREVAVFGPLLLSSGVPLSTIYEELELEHLTQLGLTRTTFERMRVRFQTQVLYRQSNYNLLREESEGYSKLITELFTTSGNEPPSADVVAGTFERVKGMIGAFDLDVGRVLDITLDIFAAVLVRKYRFFVKYLRASTWWPQQPMLDKFRSSEMAFRTLPAWALPDNTGFEGWTDEEKAELSNLRVQRDTKFWNRVREVGVEAFFELGGTKVDDRDTASIPEAARPWIEATGVAPPIGNVVAAQVLGFKLRFYSSPARSANDILPPNLLYLSALLIKIGFITLNDLYPHLWPKDDAMSESVKEQKMAEKEERERANRPGGGVSNALAMAGALTDDTLPPPISTRPKDPTVKTDGKEDRTEATDKPTEPKEVLPEPADQKVQLLKSLLCIGALPEALFMLGRFPWLPDAFPELPEHIHRILHHCLSKVYEPLQPLKDDASIRTPHTIVDPDQNGVTKGHIRRIAQSPHKTLRWAQLDKFESNEMTNYVFYWDDWADNVPICQTVDDVFSLCNSLLPFSGVKIGQDPVLLTKLARIGKNSLVTDPSDSNKARWIDLLKRLLVPALSLTRRVPGVIEEVWDLIKQFPTPVRFSIYTEWYHGTASRNPDVKVAFDQSRAETKDCLKRISKTNVKPMARLLAKIATSSPGVVFAVAINQIESYDNLVDVVVECGRYFTFLGYDVLTWSLMNALGTSKARVQADGMLTSRWLLALAGFSGKVFKRYSVMSPAPVLQYVLHQLQKSNPTDLVVLENIISSMTGIAPDADLNETQVVAMSGGKLLQAQILLQLLDKRNEASMKSTAKRLMKALIDMRLVGPLVVAIAQERQTCVYQVAEEDAHLKLLGNLYDKIHHVLVQYLDLLRTSLSVEDFNIYVPSLPELIGDFGLDPAAAFWVSRPSLAAEVTENDDKVAQEKVEAAKALKEEKEAREVAAKAPEPEDTQMTNGEASTEGQTLEGSAEVVSQSAEESNEVEMGVEKLEGSPEAIPTPSPAELDQPWHPVLQKMIETTRPLLPDETFEVLSESFYFTFWQMSLGDVFMPMASYEAESERLKRKQIAIGNDRSDLSVRGTQKKEDEKKAVSELSTQLRTEMGQRLKLFQRGKQRLVKEKDFWFVDCWGKWDALNVAILEHCFIPRATMSAVDAMFAVKLLKLLHSLGTKYFRTVGLFDQLFNKERLTSLFFLCTNREADNLGRFLNEILKELARWHKDRAVYEKEAHGPKQDLPGFCVKFKEDRTPANLMDYEDFRRILTKWHTNLNNALKVCFQGGEYMHIRNAIAILKACAPNFPIVSWMGTSMVNSVTELSKSDKREDVKLAAKALIGILKRRENSWVTVQSFSLASKVQAGAPGGKATPKSSTPQPDAGSKLNAKAPEFRPRSPSQSNDSPKPPPLRTDRMDVEEEGELKSAGLVPEAVTAPAPSADLTQSKHAPPPAAEGDQQKEEAKPDDYQNRDNAVQSKLLAPDPSQSSKPRDATARLPSRPDNRPSSLPTAPSRPPINGRTSSHTLPSRPEAPPPRPAARSERLPERHYLEDHRRDGPPDYSSQREHGYHGSGYGGGRHERDGGGWAVERGHAGRLPPDSRYEHPPARDTRGPPRDDRPERAPRERPSSDYDVSRSSDSPGRLSRDGPMAPPRSSAAPHSERANASRVAPEGHGIHPDRRADLTRQEDYRPGSQRSSRGSSPVHREDRPSRPSDYTYREDRPSGSGRPNDGRPSRPQYEEARLPSGPRGERTPDHPPSTSQSERFRESFASNSASTSSSRYPPSERTQESSFGRLNADPPSGPRTNGAPSGRGGRTVSGTTPHVNTQMTSTQNSMPSPVVPDKQTPTGPSSSRTQTRPPGPYNRPGQSSGPPTPSAESPDTVGVHPDRLKAIQGNDSGQGVPRANNMPAVTPSGPRGPINVPPTSPSTTRGPPPPMSTNERLPRNTDRRFAQLNSTLQQSGQPAAPERPTVPVNTRSRGARGPNVPISPSSGGPPPRGEPESHQSARDLRDNHPSSRPEQYDNRPAGGSSHGGGYREDDRTPRDVERRSTRHEPRPESPRRHSGAPSSMPPGPPARMSRDDTRLPPRRMDEPVRRDEMRETRTRSGALPPPMQDRDQRRGPRDDAVASGRDMRREHDGRRDNVRDEWGDDRMARERRDMGPERRDSGPPVDPGGGYGRRKRGVPEEPPYDMSKRIRR